MPGLHSPLHAPALCALGFLAMTACGLAQEGGLPGLASHYLADTWTKARGLPDDSIRAITQTPDGYLWIATRSGLARFDGVRFVTFNRANTPAFPSDEFTSLIPGTNGDLWIGTRNGLVHRSSAGYSSWLSGLPGRGSEITSVSITRSAGIWVGSRNGIYRFRGSQLEPVSFPGMPVLEEASGRLWLASAKGFHHLDPGTGHISDLLVPPDLPQWGAANSAGIIALSNGDLLAQFGQHERQRTNPQVMNWVYRFRDGAWTQLPGNPHFSHGRPFFVAPDHENALWMPDGSTRLLRVKDGVLARLSFPEGHTDDFPTCMFHDREGGFWVGLEDKGLVRFRSRKIFTLTTGDGLPDNNAWAICESRDGALWIGTDGGISRWQNGVIKNYNRQDGLARNTVRSIAEDHSGTIWVGTGNGLSFFDNGQWLAFPLPGSIGGNKIRALQVDRDGDLWIGSAGGIARIRSRALIPCSLSSKLLDIDVCALLQDRSGALWIGTDGNGLYRAQGTAFDHFTTANGLGSDTVWAIAEDSGGALWFGGNSGLQRYHNGTFHRFTRREGLPYDDINHILEDDLGNLWLSSDHGICRVSKRELEAVAHSRQSSVSAIAYSAEDGLLSIETNGRKSQPAGFKTSDGRLWFATTRGVVAFDPRRLPDNPHSPLGVIEQIRANGEVIFHNGPPLGDDGLVPQREQTTRAAQFGTLDRELRLKPGSAHVLEIQYSANTFVEAGKVTFKYRLDGLDADWVPAGTRRFAHYANLKPGHYRFRMRATTKYGLSSPEAASFAFYIQPHFYQRKAFYASCAAAFALAGFGFYRWRLRYLRKIHRLEQERALAEDRARIARDLHDSLGAQLTNLTILADTSAQRADAAQNADSRLRKLSQLARETAIQLREIIWTNHPGDESLDGLVNRLCQYAQQTLGDAAISCEFDIPSSLPNEPLTIQARHHLYLAVKEILHNTLKHAGASAVCIAIAIKHDRFCLDIQDNGGGFTRTPGSMYPGSGRGLENIQRRVRCLDGDLLVTSDPGEGVCFQISIPLQSLLGLQPSV